MAGHFRETVRRILAQNDIDLDQKLLELRANGQTLDAIAAEITSLTEGLASITRTTAMNWLNDLEEIAS